MIAVDPNTRPSCGEILDEIREMRKHPDFLNNEDNEKEMEYFDEINQKEESSQGEVLLGTIKLPKDLRKLDMSLPEPNYIKSFPEHMGQGEKLPSLTKKSRTEVDLTAWNKKDRQLPHLKVLNQKIQNRARMSQKREPSYRYDYGERLIKNSKSVDYKRGIVEKEGRPKRGVTGRGRNNAVYVGGQTPRIVGGEKRTFKRNLPHYKSVNNVGGLPKIEVRGGRRKGNQRRKGKKGNYKRPDWWG